MRSLCIAGITLLWCGSLAAQQAIDGDTIRIGDATYRIHGIDAAELRQACADGWPAGAAAKGFMSELMRGKTVVCEGKTRDRFGRVVAVCRADGLDLGADMVSAGMAWAFAKYSGDYAPNEVIARASGLGVHGHDCERAWVYRSRQRARQ